MENSSEISLPRLMGKRKTLKFTLEEMVSVGSLSDDAALPLTISPASVHMNLEDWCISNREAIEKYLLQNGAVLFRGFDVSGTGMFEAIIKAIGGDLLEYSYRSSPRSKVDGKIYTSTEYPASQTIPLHNENSYSSVWPMKIGFYCVEPAAQGGETPIADSRKVFAAIDPAIRRRFIEKEVMYQRNYGGIDLSWQTTFQTEKKSEVEQFCRHAGIGFEWKADGRLRTRNVCPAVKMHPKTSEMVWFNQAHLFHVSSLAPDVREQLLSERGEQDLPRNACYGDGSPIELSVLEEIRGAYREHAVTFPWRTGDVLILDNMLFAHGRMPFQGSRKVVVGMAEPSGTGGPSESKDKNGK
jgi:alpha-ketoglutarate-dependent taurine dioxygenase